MANGFSLGYGDRPDSSSQNFIGGNIWMQKVERGTLKINPEYKDMSLDDILTKAGLNFPVTLKQTASEFNGVWYPSEAYSVWRTDGNIPVELGRGFASNYSPISYPDILNQFFGGAVELGGVPTRAISFDNGAKGAIQFAMPEEYLVADRPHKTFLNFISSHDGTYGVTMNTCDICIICGNTFAHVFHDATAKFMVKHTKNMQEKIDDIRPRILRIEYAQKAYYNLLDKAATKQVSDALLKEFIQMMFPDGEMKPNGKVNQGPANSRINLENAIANTAAERNTSDLTIYDVFQGALRYTSYKTQNRTPDQQFEYAMNSQKNVAAYNWMVDALK